MLPEIRNERPVPWWSHTENEGLPSYLRPTSIKISGSAGKLRLSYPNQKRRAGFLPASSLHAAPVQPHGTVLHCPLVPPFCPGTVHAHVPEHLLTSKQMFINLQKFSGTVDKGTWGKTTFMGRSYRYISPPLLITCVPASSRQKTF